MRDLLLATIFFVLVPVILRAPYVGVLVWSWFGYMNPHKSMYSFAYDFPFAQIVALVTIAAMVFSKEAKRIPIMPLTIVLILYLVWVTITTVFSLAPDEAWPVWQKVMKIQLMTFITLMLINSRERIHWLVMVVAASLGYHAIKGGIFVLTTAGRYQVLGPTNTFIEGNTEIGLAMIMILPLIRYLHLQTSNPWIARGLIAAMGLTALAIIGTHSRGALLGIVVMSLFLWIKSRNKLVISLIMILFIPVALNFMPQEWFSKMETIETYEEDQSAMGRIEAWQFAISLANSKPILGGGFETFTPVVWAMYSPDPDAKSRAAHSIYFQTLGEHGYVGLMIFLTLLILTWTTAGSIIRNVKAREDLKWASDLAAMVQVSIIGYAVAGAFLSLANFDLFYQMLVFAAVLWKVVQKKLSQPPDETGEDRPQLEGNDSNPQDKAKSSY